MVSLEKVAILIINDPHVGTIKSKFYYMPGLVNNLIIGYRLMAKLKLKIIQDVPEIKHVADDEKECDETSELDEADNIINLDEIENKNCRISCPYTGCSKIGEIVEDGVLYGDETKVEDEVGAFLEAVQHQSSSKQVNPLTSSFTRKTVASCGSNIGVADAEEEYASTEDSKAGVTDPDNILSDAIATNQPATKTINIEQQHPSTTTTQN